MSRSSNRGPRADIALLRKLKADPNFSPSSLLNAGNNILEKANKLKGFVAEQRGKLGASSAKTEWLLAYQHLQAEHDEADRELSSCLQQLADQQGSQQLGAGGGGGGAGGGSELREVAEALSVLYAQSETCRAERQQLRSQVRGLSSVHGSFKAYGAPSSFSREAGALKVEMSSLAQELEAGLTRLAADAVALSAELRDGWPSAMSEGQAAGLGGGGDAAALAAAGGGGGLGHVAEDVEELERMMARFPLASPDIKDRIRQVFDALQDKYIERLETWRWETDHAATTLTASPFHASAPAGVRAGAGPGAARTAGRGGAPGGVGGRTAAGRGGSPGPPSIAGGRGGGAAAAGAAGRGGVSRPLQPVVVPKRVSAAMPANYDGDLEPLDDTPPPAAGQAVAVAGGAVAGGPAGCPAAWLLSGYGGWSADDHSAFVRHRERLMRESGQAGGKPGGREAVMGRIAGLLPGGRSAAQVVAHDDWSTASRQAARRRRDLAEGWDRERRQFIEDSSSFLAESETVFLAEAEEAADRLVTELLRERANDELQERRAERAHEEEVAAAERGAREAAEAEARIVTEAAARLDRAAKKEAVSAYRADLERQAADSGARIAAAQEGMAELAAEQAVYNKERVEWRQAEYLVRQDKAKEAAAEAAAEEEAREARLERLRLLVAPQVEADPQRLLAPTAASSAAASAAEEEEGRKGQAFNPVNGYTTAQVVRDQRFKVREALTRMGLHETDYGRAAIAAAKPAQAPRLDNFTSDQRAAQLARQACR